MADDPAALVAAKKFFATPAERSGVTTPAKLKNVPASRQISANPVLFIPFPPIRR